MYSDLTIISTFINIIRQYQILFLPTVDKEIYRSVYQHIKAFDQQKKMAGNCGENNKSQKRDNMMAKTAQSKQRNDWEEKPFKPNIYYQKNCTISKIYLYSVLYKTKMDFLFFLRFKKV